MIDLKGLYRVTAKGRTYFYAWRGGPRMKTDPAKAAAFAEEFVAHHAARKGGDPKALSGVIVQWKRSPAWTVAPELGGMAETTKRSWKGPLDDIHAEFGSVPMKAFEDTSRARKRIKKWLEQWRETPRARDTRKQVFSALLSFAIEEDLLTTNPCFNIANIYEVDRSEVIWTEDDIARFTIASGSAELTWALELACLTGLRQADLLRLSWSHISDLAIEMVASKTRFRGRYQRTAQIPLYDELRTLLAEIPKRSTVVLTNQDGRPWKSGFSSSWNKGLRASGLLGKLRFHDSRGTFATWAYTACNFKVAEIAEMLAWSPEKAERIIHRYVARDAAIRLRIRRLDEARQNNVRTETAKPTAKPGQEN